MASSVSALVPHDEHEARTAVSCLPHYPADVVAIVLLRVRGDQSCVSNADAPLDSGTAAPGPESEDNQHVRRLVAAAVLVLFASLNAIDGICCPDGCTYEPSTSQRHGPESPDGTCVLCLGGVESAAAHAPAASGIATNRFAPLLFTRHLDAPADPPDHPPRA